MHEESISRNYADALLALAEKKRADNRDVVKIEEQVAEDEADSGHVIDIMSALKERLGAARATPLRETAKRADQETSERRASSKSSHGSRSRRRTSAGTSSKP